MKKSIQVFLLIFTLIIMTLGCSTADEEIADITASNQELELLVEKLTEENNGYQEEIHILKYNVDDLEQLNKSAYSIINEQNSIIQSLQQHGKEENIIFPIYTANIDTYELEIAYYTSIPKSYSLNDKIDSLAQTISKNNFSNLPIEVVKIEQIDGKQIATINLKELPENQGINEPENIKGKTWKYQYFQGTTGAAITSIILEETFLQRAYDGEWIDGVQFLYENETSAIGHVDNLFEVKYREQ